MQIKLQKLFTPFRNGIALFAITCLVGMGCADTPADSVAEEKAETPIQLVAQNYADSVAIKAYDALGGPAAFAALPALQFNFGFERGENRTVARKHFWDKYSGDYRLEYTVNYDSSYVVLFNVNDKSGDVYLNGEKVGDEDTEIRLEQAYSSFINDVYWLIAPMKMMDGGVIRTHVPDSSDAATDVLKLTFEGVGLTPGDTYWMYVDKESGQLKRWAFVLEGNQDAAPRVFDWVDYQTFETPAGPVTFGARKQGVGGNFALLTDGIQVFDAVPDGIMTQTSAMLD